MKNILLAIRRNRKLFAISIIFGITTLWAIYEPFVSICFPDAFSNPNNKYWFLLIFLLPSFIIALIRIYPQKSISIELKNTNSFVNIKFGDLFEQDGLKAISVNEYFDSEIGKPVSDKSIHGYFIKKVLGGKKEMFDKAVSDSLSDINTINNKRDLGKSEKYPIGSTACLEFGDNKYLLFALAKTNENYEAYTKPSLLLEAIDGLLEKARSECNGYDLNIPLVGSGLSRSGIPSKYIIELILISILKETKKNEITNKINIIIDESKFKQIDLNDIKRKWNS